VTIVFARRLYHPLTFVDEQRHGLFAIDVLARGASHDGEQGVPMVRRGNDDSLDIFVLVHLSEVGVALGIGAD